MTGRLKQFFSAQDMTTGSPMSRLVQFSIPLLIGNLAQLLYNTVDSIVVGHYVGDNALAAIGVTMPVSNLFIILFMGVSTGATILVSQCFGARDKEKLSHAVGCTITMTIIVCAIIACIAPLSGPLLRLLDTPAEIYDDALAYLLITFMLGAGSGMYNILSGVLRGLGDSVSPLIFLIVASLLNIALDIWFVAGFHWGVPGVAIATILAQTISAFLCLIRLKKMTDILTLNRHMLKPDRHICFRLIQLGIPSGLAQGVFSMSALVVQSLTNSLGTAVIACSTVVMRVDSFAMMPNFTFGTAMTTYTGQNVGAGRMDRVEKGAKVGTLLGLIVSTFLTVCLLLFGKYLMQMFTDTPSIVALGTRMIQILAAGYIVCSLTQILTGVMRGAGDTMTPMWLSIVTTVIIRLPLAYAIAHFTKSELYPNGAPESLFVSLLVAWVLGGIFSIICYKFGSWRKKAQILDRTKAADPAETQLEAESMLPLE